MTQSKAPEWRKRMGKPTIYDETNIGQYIDCENRDCYGGGFPIVQKLHEMVGDQKTEAEFSELCDSSEGSPKGRRLYGPCLNLYQVKIKVEYRSESEQPEKHDG